MSLYGSLKRFFALVTCVAAFMFSSAAPAQDKPYFLPESDAQDTQDAAQDNAQHIANSEEPAPTESVSLDSGDDHPASDDGDTAVDTGNESDIPEGADDSEEASETPDSRVLGHGMQLAMSFIGVPGSFIDTWFAYHGNMWDNGAVNMGFSLDYFLRFKAPCEMRFGLSWASAKTGDAYWLDFHYSAQPHLADYVVNNYSVISLEVAAYHVIPIIDEVAFYYGGGLWGGLILDDARVYAINGPCASNSEDITKCPHDPGSVPNTQFPKGFGFVIATVGFKFTLWDMMTIRAEGGFKGYFYGQLGVGIQF